MSTIRDTRNLKQAVKGGFAWVVVVVIRRDAPAVASVQRPFVATYFFRDATKLISLREGKAIVWRHWLRGESRGQNGVQTKHIINSLAYKLHITLRTYKVFSVHDGISHSKLVEATALVEPLGHSLTGRLQVLVGLCPK